MRGYLFFCAAGYRCPGHTVLPRHSALDAEVWSYRATTRYPEISAKAIPTRATFLSPCIRARGDPACSFFSTARRTNQEVPPLLSGFVARRLSPPSGAAELAALKQSSPFFLGRLVSSRPDKGGVCFALAARLRLMWLRSFRALSSFLT